MTKTNLPAVEVRRISAGLCSPALCSLPLDDRCPSETRYTHTLFRPIATAFHLAAVLRDRGGILDREDYVVTFLFEGEQLSLPLDVWPALFAPGDGADGDPSKLRLLLELVIEGKGDPAAALQDALDELRNPTSTPVAA